MGNLDVNVNPVGVITLKAPQDKIRQSLLAQGQRVGRHRIARLMRVLGLRDRPYLRKKPRPRARGTEPRAKNLLNQDFQAPAPNQRWVSDITYIRTGEG